MTYFNTKYSKAFYDTYSPINKYFDYKMKIYCTAPDDHALKRVEKALIQYAPSDVEFVSDKKQADLVILHVTGRLEHTQREVDRIRKRGQKYAVIQYVVRSSINPDLIDWLDSVWLNAEMVWSYYDIGNDLTDEYERKTAQHCHLNNLYHAPLGVDSEVFQDRHIERDFMIGCSGRHALSESVKECVMAAKANNGRTFHLGHDLRRGSDVLCVKGMTDYTLSHFYSRCEFVSGLRRIEGFELPVIEGLLCGARPIVFDRPEMRHWYGEIAEFIHEGTREEVTEQLTSLFKRGARPIKQWEKDLVRERFDWKTIINGFYKQL